MNETDAALLKMFGTTERPPKEHEFQAGALCLKVADGQITSLEWQGSEVLCGISYLVRDASWATCASLHTMTVLTQSEEVFSLLITHEISSTDIQFTAALELEGHAKGHLTIRSTGTANSDFETNRAGFTLLHPQSICRGALLKTTHSDGLVEQTAFPDLISPAQPVVDIQALAHGVAAGFEVDIRLSAWSAEGKTQTFEMEDQRNWGDASYKTYVGSLHDPWPFALHKGQTIRQDVDIRLRQTIPAHAAPMMPEKPQEPVAKHPRIGLFVPPGGAQAALTNVQTHGCFSPGFLSGYLRTSEFDPDEVHALCALQRRFNCEFQLELEVSGDPATSLPDFARKLDAAGLECGSILACPAAYLQSYQPNGDWPDVMPLDAFYGLVRQAFLTSLIGGGMLTFFTELNRFWPPADAIDFVGHTFSPTIHTADDRTIMQNLETLPAMARTVAHQMPGMPYRLLSATLAMRQNPYGQGLVQTPGDIRMAMAETDPRQRGEYAAHWALEVLRALSGTHVEAVALGALSGPSSIFPDERGAEGLPIYRALMEAVQSQIARESQFHRLPTSDG